MENNKNNKIVVLLRGCPGSGKSTYIRNNYPQAVVCSADHFFVDKKGKYNFDFRMLGRAHDQCKNRFHEALKSGESVVAVDNTNRTMRELRSYVELARKYGYEVQIVRIEVDPKVAFERGVHGVPEDKVKSMAEGMAPLPEGLTEIVVKQ